MPQSSQDVARFKPDKATIKYFVRSNPLSHTKVIYYDKYWLTQ